MAAHNLPLQTAPIIGRERELAEVSQLLDDPACCLLTLVGLGGIGKTRLAMEVAAQRTDDFLDGVYWVSLQTIQTVDELVPAIIASLSVQMSSDPYQQLLSFLHEKNLLLILDNFEHLLPGVDLLHKILSTARQVKILVTTREALGIQEEWVYRIYGLDVPPEDTCTDIDGYGAVQLFTYNAHRVWWRFSPQEEALAVCRICQLVEGMPLALELAASWLRALTCQDIVNEIQRNLEFLKSTSPDIPVRQHSIQAVFQQSWELLSEHGQESFQKLSVFRGGFTRDAAEKVANPSLDILIALVDKSFIRKTTAGRFEMHELLRQFGEERLEEAGAVNVTKAAHSSYYMLYLQGQEAGLKSQRQLQC